MGGFSYFHNCYCHLFFPVSTIIIAYNYIQINKACIFSAVLKSWGLPTDENCRLRHWFIIQNYWDWFKKIMPRFPTTRMLVPVFHEFCRILNWFCLLLHVLRHKDINHATFSYSNLQFQLIVLTGACRKPQIWWSGT